MAVVREHTAASVMITGAPEADLILIRGRFTTFDRSQPTENAVAIEHDKFIAVGHDEDVAPLAGAPAKIIYFGDRRVLSGLIDNHLLVVSTSITAAILTGLWFNTTIAVTPIVIVV